MYQLRNLICRSNVSGDPTKKYNECDAFLKLIITCYVFVAAFKHLKIESLSDIPKINDVNNPQQLWRMPLSHERKAVFFNCYVRGLWMNSLHFGSISHLDHLQARSDFINCDLFNLSINAFVIKPIVISHIVFMFMSCFTIGV